MNQEAFVRLNRRFFSHYLWAEDRDYSRAEAWLDMIQLASFEDGKRIVKGMLVNVPRGGIVASERFLSDRWKWSRTKVRAFLDVLKADSMISVKKDQENTIITLCNYDGYNEKKTTERPQKDHRKTSEEPQKDQIKEGIEGKEEPNGSMNLPRGGPSRQEIVDFCFAEGLPESDGDALFNKWMGNGFKNNKDPVKDWKATIRSWRSYGYLPSQKPSNQPKTNGNHSNARPAQNRTALAPGGSW